MNTLSLVIPVYNEEKRLPKTFKALKKGFGFRGIKLEAVIFVDDGSTDQTACLIKSEKERLEKALKAKIKLISFKVNKGKGAAVRAGMLASRADYTLFFDADMATPLTEFKKFLPFIEKGVPVIIGTRKNGESTVQVPQPWYRRVLGKGFTYLTNIVLNTWVTDFTCGFKAFSREAKNEVFARAMIDRWGYDAEILFLARKLGLEIKEKAVLWYDDRESRVRLVKDLPRTLKELIQIRLNHWRLTVPLPLIRNFRFNSA
jgi:dolichyl-phosphate beta-glucosyltransferase